MAFKNLKAIKMNIRRPILQVPIKETSSAPKAINIKIKCKICMYAFKSFPAIMKCARKHCLFCEECSAEYIKSKIFERNVPIQCEVAHCDAEFNDKCSVF
jgi:hypothetical protein